MTNRPTVLVVDDERPMRELVALALEPAGYEALLAGSGSEALDVLSEAHVDVVLTDVMMPEVGGIELARRARAAYPQIAIAFMSGCAGPEVASEFDGATFLEKPFTVDQLAAAIDEALSVARANRR